MTSTPDVYSVCCNNIHGTLKENNGQVKIELYDGFDFITIADFLKIIRNKSCDVIFHKNGRPMFKYSTEVMSTKMGQGMLILKKAYHLLKKDFELPLRHSVNDEDIIELSETIYADNVCQTSMSVNLIINNANVYKMIESVRTYAINTDDETKMKVTTALMIAAKNIMK